MTRNPPVPETLVGAQDLVRSLFVSQYGSMVRLAQYLSGDPDAGQEIAQEAFAVLLRRWADLSEPEGAAGYLRRVVVNLARSRVRRRRMTLRHQARLAVWDSGSAERSVDLNERRQMIALLLRLPRRQRECLVLRYYLDLAESDIAESLGISTGSVKTHCSRGLAALARALGEGQ
jgi:RNA polymerase sigma-70 factor (sigma-E family)